MTDVNDIREAKRKRQEKKMTKIIAKAWSLEQSEIFQEIADPELKALTGGPLDLTTMGRSLDSGIYPLGRQGWETFARDMGFVYNRFIVSGKKKKLAQKHLNEVCAMLAKIDQSLQDIASKSKPENIPTDNKSPKKRKAAELNSSTAHIPKKKNASSTSRSSSREESLTLSQREERGMANLSKHVVDCGGDTQQVNSFRCKATQSGDRYQLVYFSEQGRKFRSMADVARFLNLTDGASASVSGSQKKSTPNNIAKTGRPRNMRELEAERKKLRRELDKLVKAHDKATKTVEDYQNERGTDHNPMDDYMLRDEENSTKGQSIWKILTKPEIDSFPGLPTACTQDVLMVWDFLCTFSRTLSLEPISLDYFAEALIYKPAKTDYENDPLSTESYPPVYLAEAHLALLRLLLSDQSSDEWWWSTLETPETEALENENTGRGEADNIIPLIKVDLGALLDMDEDPDVTKRWLQALEDVRERRTNSGGAIKSAVKTATSITKNPLVKAYLRKSLQNWQSNAASFTKQSVMWLIGRFREARPDLWGRKINQDVLNEQKAIIIRDAAASMAQLVDAPELENVDDAHYGDSDDEDLDSDDDENSEGEAADEDFIEKNNGNFRGGNTTEEKDADDSMTLVTSPIPTKPPPTLVDLLLPPTKPNIKSNIVSPFTWPFLSGASVCRILHRYKRLRNEVDDNLREFRDLSPLTKGERRERERKAAFRLFSECFSLSNSDQESPVEDAVDFLCKGGEYLELKPIQRLCILRVLIESAYDTYHVNQCVQGNITARKNAITQLEREEKNAKKKAKEGATALESAARERLAKEAKNEFLTKKRREIARTNKQTNEFTKELIDSMTIEEMIEMDEETKTEYEAIPGPQQFSKAEVRVMVKKITEENAFSTNELEVLTLDEIESREANMLAEMEEELATYANSETYNREITAKINKLNREIEIFKEWQLNLPDSRREAIEHLKEAIEDGTIKALRTAIKAAKGELLCGEDDESGGMWAVDLLRDAALELKQAETRKRVTEAQRDLIAKRNKCFVRTEELGSDRAHNKFWKFDHDNDGRIWFEAEFALNDSNESSHEPSNGQGILSIDVQSARIDSQDEEVDLMDGDKQFLHFSRQEYHSSGKLPSLAKSHQGCLSSTRSLRALLKYLDGRGVREGALKSSLQEIVEASGVAASDSVNGDKNDGHKENTDPEKSFQKEGDEDAFGQTKNIVNNDGESLGKGIELLSSMNTAIGQRCRLRIVQDPNKAPDVAMYQMGTVIGWTVKVEQQIVNADENSGEEPNYSKEGVPVWCIAMDNGIENEVKASDLLDGLVRAMNWKHQYPGYYEHDSLLVSYRNKMGRFCGRAVDAPYASSALFVGKLMLECERDCYTPLKSRTYENNWGGKSGARNAWIAAMKEHANDLNAVRDGLLTLENALFEMCGGTQDEEETVLNNSSRSGRDLLEDKEFIFEIELESLGQKINGLWNSKEARLVFREVVSSSTSVGFVALCLDLLCRNCIAYLGATKANVTRNQSSYYDQAAFTMGRMTRSSLNYDSQQDAPPPSNPRRMNAWQQRQQNASY